MVARAVAERAAGHLRQPAEHVDVLAERLERLHRRAELEIRAHRLRRPHERARALVARADDAVGRVDVAQSHRRLRRPDRRQRRRHRVEQRQRHRRAKAAEECSPGQRVVEVVHESDALPHLKRRAFHDRQNQRRDPIIVARRVASDRANCRIVVVLDAASECIGQQFFGGRSHEIVAVFRQKQLAQPGRTLELGAVGQLAARVDRRARILGAPPADAVVVLQREPDRIHPGVAGGADGVGPVHLHLLAHRQHLAVRRRLQLRNVGRRRRRRRAEQVLENPLAALHHRRAIGIRRHRQDAALAEQAVPIRVGRASRAGTASRTRAGCRSARPAAG